MLRLNLSVISQRDDHVDNILILPIAIMGKKQHKKSNSTQVESYLELPC